MSAADRARTRRAAAAERRASNRRSRSSSGGSSSGGVVGGGPSPELKALSIALANKDPLPSGVKADVFDRNTGKRTGSTIDVGGRRIGGNVYSDQINSLSGQLRETQLERDAAAASAAEAEQEATNVKAKGSLSTTLVGGQGLAAAESNPYASGSFTAPAFDPNRYGQNADFFNQMFDPNATINTTGALLGGNQTNDGGFQGFQQGMVGGGGFTWGGGQGQYTPGISGDGQALTATRNLGNGSPTPTSKEQAEAAGIEDTSGQSAVNATAGNDHRLKKTMMQLVEALSAQRDLLESQLTGTADPVDNAVANMDNALNTAYEAALADLPDTEAAEKRAKDLFEYKVDLIEDRRDQLEDRFEDDKDAIEADFDQQKDDLTQTQKGQTGRLAGGLASAGAYLGFDNVNHSAMLSLQVTHDREMTVLGQGKIAALNEARRAFQDSDFALLTEHVNAVEAYDNKITELANNHFNQTLQLTQEARNNVKFMQETEAFERNKSFDNLDAVVEAGTMPTPNDINEYARSLNLSPEDVRGYIQSKQNTMALEKDRQKTADDIALQRLLLSVPAGTTVTINGKTYAGKKPATAAAGSADKGTDIVSAKDVFDNFGNNPLARQFIGKTTNELYNFFGQEQMPEDLDEYYEAVGESTGELSTDPELAEAQKQMAWEADRRGILGYPRRTDVNDLSEGADTLTSAVQEINQQLIESLGEDKAKAQLVTQQDIYNDPIEYPPELLEIYADQAAARAAVQKEAIDNSGGFFSGFLGGEE